MMLLVPFSSCCCYEFWLPGPPAAAEAFAAAAGPRMGKHHGSEGRKSIQIATKNSLPRMGKHRGSEGRKSSKIATKNSLM